MHWIKKHVDTVVVLSSVFGAFLWMNGKFNVVNEKFTALDEKFNTKFDEISVQLNELKTDMAVIKAVLIIKGIMPSEVAVRDAQEK